MTVKDNNSIENMDVEYLKQISQQASARTLKREYIKKGYEYQFSLYGVMTDKTTKTSEYRRIEILSNIPYDGVVFFDIYEFFSQVIPPSKYSLWIYDKDKKAVQVIGVFD